MATQTDTMAGIRVITLGRQKLSPPPLWQEGGGEEGCSEEPELSHDQNIEVRDRELKVGGRLKYFLSVWMAITSDRKILDMIEHCHLEFTENPSQQYPKPPIRFNSEEAVIIDGEIQQFLSRGVLEETVPSHDQYISTIFLRKKKSGSCRLILNLKGLDGKLSMCYTVNDEKLLHGLYRPNRRVLHCSCGC